MAIPVVLYKPKLVDGERLSNDLIELGVTGAIGGFPSVSEQEQTAGITQPIKVFAKIADANNTWVSRATTFLKASNLSLQVLHLPQAFSPPL